MNTLVPFPPDVVLAYAEAAKAICKGVSFINRRYDTPFFGPLAGHSGHCAKVTQATVTGETTARCDCGAGSCA